MESIIVSSSKTSIKFWDYNTGKLKHTLKNAHKNWIFCLTKVPAPTKEERIRCPYYLASGSVDKSIKIWKPKGDYKLIKEVKHDTGVLCVQSIGENEFVSSDKSGRIRLWDFSTSKCIRDLRIHYEAISVVCPLTANMIATSSREENVIEIFNIRTSSFSVLLSGHSNVIWRIIKLSDSKIASCSSDCTIRIWDWKVSNGDNLGKNNIGKCLNVLKDHSQSVKDIVQIGNQEIASCSVDLSIKLWKIYSKDGKAYRTIKNAHKDIINSLVCVHKKNKTLISCSDDNTIKFWNIPNDIEKEVVCERILECENDVMRIMLLEDQEFMDEQHFEEKIDLIMELEDEYNNNKDRKTPNLFRIDFVHPENEYSLSLFKSLFGLTKLDNIQDQNLQLFGKINQIELIKLLLGKKYDIPEESFFDLYVIFKKLKMEEHLLILLKIIQSITDLDLLSFWYIRALQVFEKCTKLKIKEHNFSKFNSRVQFDHFMHDHIPEVIERIKNPLGYWSVFTLNIENLVKRHVVDYLKRKGHKKTVEELTDELKQNLVTSSDIENHYDIRHFNLRWKNKNFVELHKENQKLLYQTKKFSNIQLLTEDGGDFKAHIEVLILNSKFFTSLFKFKGKERASFIESRVVKIEILNSGQLKTLLQYIYLKEIDKGTKLRTLFKLIEISIMFFEKDLEKFIFQKIVEQFKEFHASNTFFLQIMQNSRYLNALPQHKLEKFLNFSLTRLNINPEEIKNILNFKNC